MFILGLISVTYDFLVSKFLDWSSVSKVAISHKEAKIIFKVKVNLGIVCEGGEGRVQEGFMEDIYKILAES